MTLISDPNFLSIPSSGAKKPSKSIDDFSNVLKEINHNMNSSLANFAKISDGIYVSPGKIESIGAKLDFTV
ncbi:hypothetical protein A2230_01460 [candidate division WOR-1 bacterium RIFOXYA2_FULL_36_21]|uniref:Uncharacterized protein n=1 Tax=candidate division WOR-1 bacterium RIFOXYB2_FULL_36_35 TaxID=1802578 RepID=A0A1F4S699_UNCSA|nr:MAG: hypothetical protein A2230_01460 [candidate division WOR-1 bacterium RIFOXYA2_FULL_36_21]OGC14358.1 MAG: hypothetical protein A2282_07895 [candidate division WOR-1 bacterium RIFOXYA12_FULL_36_13]OGC15966.1 MAG: hypothetical protein A2290_06930 [candidate division WOR-1 bacterium RIFOXYB2_FULL_36_35]